MLTLTPGRVSLAELERVWRDGAPARLDPATAPGIATANPSTISSSFSMLSANCGFRAFSVPFCEVMALSCRVLG